MSVSRRTRRRSKPRNVYGIRGDPFAPAPRLEQPRLRLERYRQRSELVLVLDGDEMLARASFGICPRGTLEFAKWDAQPADGPYFHADTGQGAILYLDRVESTSPRAFFALMAEIRKVGLPVWAHFTNIRARAIAELRYRA